ncbi:MAG: sulfatase-like hydrolase/transferase [Caldilineaceae bacterium]
MSARVNILLIHADQHRADCLGVNGHPLLKTPHLDQLATEGVNFTHAYTPIPLCTPARTSLLTGQWPMQHGVITNYDAEAGRSLPLETPTVSQRLHEAGYFLGYVGKWGVDPRHTPLDFGFHVYHPESNYTKHRAAQGLPPQPATNRWFGECDPYITPQQSQLAWGADRTIELIHQATAQPEPFFLRWDPSAPHLPNVPPEPYATMYPPAEIPPWPNFADPLTNKPYIQRQQRRTWGIDDWTWQEWAPVVGRYLGEISLLDQQIGRVLAALTAAGLAENTLVIYSADHGDLCGGHGMIDKHYVMYEELVRVPLLMRWPNAIAAGSTQHNFVSSALDLAATLCDAAGVTPIGSAAPSALQGQSLLSLAQRNTSTGARPDIYTTYHGNQFGLYSQRMVRDPHWKYIWNATAEDELYDLDRDPGELVNCIDDEACSQIRHRLRQRLVIWMEATNDRLLNSWIREQLLEGRKG